MVWLGSRNEREILCCVRPFHLFQNNELHERGYLLKKIFLKVFKNEAPLYVLTWSKLSLVVKYNQRGRKANGVGSQVF